jgi:hypothetical protein
MLSYFTSAYAGPVLLPNGSKPGKMCIAYSMGINGVSKKLLAPLQ